MKEKFITLIGVILPVLLGYVLTSCDAEQAQDRVLSPNQITLLEEYGYLHNQGLDYIKEDIAKSTGVYSRDCLTLAFHKFVNEECNIPNMNKEMALEEIGPMTGMMFKEFLPTLNKTRTLAPNLLPEKTNQLAQEAVIECLSNIAKVLNNINENDIFDNKLLLNQLLQIITSTHKEYLHLIQSNADTEALDTAFGILFGSIQYWTNSSNVNFWTQITMEEENLHASEVDNSLQLTRAKEEEKKEETLSKSEWLILVATVDTAGGLLGSGIATVPAAAAASAAAALFFDVE